MPLEATMICLDNSEWMRNGDFVPSRMESQKDAINMLFGSKLNSHPENTVGLISMAEKGEVLVTLTTEIGKLLSRLHAVKIGGKIDFINCVRRAELALKYRVAQNHPLRIVVFVASPIHEDIADLVKLAKRLKKNSVNVDVVNFGEDELNAKKLETFITTVDKDGLSHLVSVPSGVGVLSDSLLGSPILGVGGGAGGGGGADEFGVDSSMDPELALALRVSMEEARMAHGHQSQDGGGGGASTMSVDTQDPASMTEEEQIQQAMRMSLDVVTAVNPTPFPQPITEQASIPAPVLISSLPVVAAAAASEEAQDMFSDPDFLASVLGNLPGVDANDASIQAVLAEFQNPEKKDDKDKMHE